MCACVQFHSVQDFVSLGALDDVIMVLHIFLPDICGKMLSKFLHQFVNVWFTARPHNNPGLAGGQTPSPSQMQLSGLVSSVVTVHLFK